MVANAMRRYLIIAGVVVLVILLGVAAYFLFFKPKAPGITTTPGNPFGEGGDYTGGGTGTNSGGNSSGEAGTEVAPHFFKITDGPVAYGTLARSISRIEVVETGSGTSTGTTTRTVFDTEARYVERASGNVFTYEFNKRALTRISNKTLPGVEEASWAPSGSLAFLRFLSTNENGADNIDTYALKVGEEDGGYFLETGLSQVLVSGSSTVITLLPSSTGSIATSARIDGASPKTLFTSALSALRIFSSGSGIITATNASAQVDGFAFLVSATGSFERILGPLRGLTVLPSPSGKSVLYSYVSGSNVTGGVLNLATRTATTLPVAVLPEKCVWAADEMAVYCAIPRATATGWPDAWYQGTASFSDRIWKIDMAARVAALIVDPVAVANVPIDGVSLAVDQKEDVLIFTNRKDGSLWAYDL